MILISKKKIVFVLGMHRSGTFAITRVLNLLGFELGDNILEAKPDNSKEYWENKDIVESHERILELMGQRWDDANKVEVLFDELRKSKIYASTLKIELKESVKYVDSLQETLQEKGKYIDSLKRTLQEKDEYIKSLKETSIHIRMDSKKT